MVPAGLDGSWVIGVDVGGTKIAAALVSREGSIEGRIEQPTDVASEDALLSQLDAIVEGLRHGAEVASLGVGIPSRIDQRRGRAVASVNVPLENVDLRDRMRERHGLPVAIDNDASAAAIAEWRWGAAQGARDVVMLTLGTGVGGGLILGGRPYRGATGSGAELGHVVVELDGPPCRCGGRGHLESFATGVVADELARERFGPGSDAYDLVRRAVAGEPAALEALAGMGRGGFGEAAAEFLLGSARDALAQDALQPGRDTLRVVQAQLGGDAGVIGAGMIAFEALDAGT
jgi:glucokinase